MVLSPGTKAVIKPDLTRNGTRDSNYLKQWVDFPVEIDYYQAKGAYDKEQYHVKPLVPRPDLIGTNDEYYAFYWNASEIEEVQDDSLPRDTQNKVIRIGSTVVYPVRSGSSMTVQTAKVTGIVYEDKSKVVFDKHPDGSYDYASRRHETQSVPYIKVERPSTKWVYDPVANKGEYVPSTWRGPVRVLNRVTVIN